jgi:hypothetical protein
MGRELKMDQVLEFMEELKDIISMSHWGNIPQSSRQYEPVFSRILGGATLVSASTFYLIARLP